MRILFHDVIQHSPGAPEELKSPALSMLFFPMGGIIDILLDKPRPVNSIGIGNTNGTYFDALFNGGGSSERVNFTENGLYLLKNEALASRITIKTDAVYIGRLGAGLGVHIPTAIAKEPSFASTSNPRVTLSGQVIPGAGGYHYRTLSLDSRYKITREIMDEIWAGYETAGKGFPYFIDLADEAYKLPFSKLYAADKNQGGMTFQSGVRRYLYSKKFDFEERF
jgi:hypothetical protein